MTQSYQAFSPGTYEQALDEVVHNWFGFDSLSADQDQLIRASIEGHDVLGILPTGSGKSACFQIPGIVTQTHTLVVSPLIALQDDQVRSLRHIGAKAFAFHSNLEDSKRDAVKFYYSRPREGQASFLYISPELLLTQTFDNMFASAKFDRIAVDEAHCVSTWGNSFRPDYQRIRVAVRKLHIPICSAFTATVDPRIERDIRKRTPIKPDHVRVAMSPLRPNLNLQMKRLPEIRSAVVASRKKRESLTSLLEHPEYRGAVIVYCTSKSVAVTLYERLRNYRDWLKLYGYHPYLYHGALPYEDKQAALRGFLSARRPIVIATSAFGMGINRADVRQVVHYQTPYTLIDYAQQIGRAGRDGLPALCTSYHTPHELNDLDKTHISYQVPQLEFVEKVHGWLRKAVSQLPSDQRRKYNLRTFLTKTQHMVVNSDQITHKERYMDIVRRSVAILQRAGLIVESGDGFFVVGIDIGGPIFNKLVELTEMQLRMEIRERERIEKFFSHPNPTQEMLWEILQEK